MGLFLAKMYEALTAFSGADYPSKILMLGLDAAGKTTILYKVKLNEVVTSIPTIGFNVETVTPVKGVTFTVWDIGGQKILRALWRNYYHDAHGLLFIVDSSDVSRIEEAKEELLGIIESDEMRGVPVVVMANKQDLPGALNTSDVADKMGLMELRNRKWHVQGACAVTGEGVYEGMHEMARLVKEFQKQSGR